MSGEIKKAPAVSIPVSHFDIVDWRALETAVAKALSVRPEIVLAASKDGGKSMAMWTDDLIRKEDIEFYCRDHPEYSVTRLERFPRYAEYLNLAWILVEELRDRGWSVELRWHKSGRYAKLDENPKAVFQGDDEPFVVCGIADTMSRAITLAAGKVLKVWT
jgi:hypothetical protein